LLLLAAAAGGCWRLLLRVRGSGCGSGSGGGTLVGASED